MRADQVDWAQTKMPPNGFCEDCKWDPPGRGTDVSELRAELRQHTARTGHRTTIERTVSTTYSVNR